MKPKHFKSGSNLVPVTVNGVRILVDAASIAESAKTVHHGMTANGIKVNSPASFKIGESVIFYPNGARGGPAMSIGKDDLEVFATQYLTNDCGLKISAQAGQ